MTVGTLPWACRTGGVLGWRDRLQYLGGAVAMQLRILPAELRWRLGLPRPGAATVDVGSLQPPDGAGARRAAAHLEEIAAPFLVNHSLRTYFWSRILAGEAHASLDDELLYVASLMHDAGFVDPHRGGTGRPQCFTIRGAEAAAAMMRDAGWSAPRCDRLAEAIVLHVNPRVRPGEGLEAHFLNAGVLVDVMGTRVWELHPDTLRDVLGRLPRLDMKRVLWEAWKSEAGAHPGCRAAFANRYLQFGWRVRTAPFDE